MLTLPGHSSPIYSLTYSPDGRLLASCDTECVRLWDVASGQESPTIGKIEGVKCMRFSPDSKCVALGATGNPVGILDITSGRLLNQNDNPPRYAGTLDGLAFSPDGTRLAVAMRDTVNRVCMYDLTKASRRVDSDLLAF